MLGVFNPQTPIPSKAYYMVRILLDLILKHYLHPVQNRVDSAQPRSTLSGQWHCWFLFWLPYSLDDS